MSKHSGIEPLISVITTVYNGEKYISMAVKSVLNQTHDNFEYIIVNDGSNDATAEILDGLSDKRLKILHTPRLGRAKALNLSVRNSSGDYIAVLDADDVCLPDRLRLQADFLNSYPDVGLLSSSRRYIIDEHGEVVGSNDTGVLDHDSIVDAMATHNPMFHSSTMYRKKLFYEIGGYDERLFCFLDYDFYMRSAAITRLANLDCVLVYKRGHNEQYFFGKEDRVKTYQKLMSASYINYRKVKYIGASKKYLLWALKSYIKSMNKKIGL